MSAIVLARIETDFVATGEDRTDLGERRQLRPVPRPVAALWLLDGDEAAVARAREYAAGGGWQVFVYPTGTADPTGRARADVMAKGAE